MADVKWIKITTDMFDDEKIDFISSLPEGDAMLVIWIRLLTMAGKCNAGGFIFLTESIPYTDDMMAHKFNKPTNIVRLAIETFAKLNMLQVEDGKLVITNWTKHQNIEGMEKVREQSRLRMQKHRENIKLLRNGDATVTQSNAIDIDIEEDKELEINITAAERELLGELKSINNYPYSFDKDLDFIHALLVDFPNIDLLDKVKAWKTWLLDNPLKSNSNPRSQIRNWMKPKKWEQGKQFNKKQQRHDEPGVFEC